MNNLADTHCHLNFPDFSADLELVLSHAADQGIQKILVPGTSVESSRASAALSSSDSVQLFAAAGIHPNTEPIMGEDLRALRDLLGTHVFHAVGEIGLDYYRMRNLKKDQMAVFVELLNLASEKSLPVCLHNRDADEDMIRILDEWIAQLRFNENPLANTPGVFHAFNGSERIAEWAIDNHFYLGIGGVITYPKATGLRHFVAGMNPQHLLIETDAPFLAPIPYRGKRNQPGYVRVVAAEVALLKGMTFSDVVKITSENADTLFKWNEEINKTT